MIKNIINLILRYHTSIQRHAVGQVVRKRILELYDKITVPSNSGFWIGGVLPWLYGAPAYQDGPHKYGQYPIAEFKIDVRSLLLLNSLDFVTLRDSCMLRLKEYTLKTRLAAKTAPQTIWPQHYWHYYPSANC